MLDRAVSRLADADPSLAVTAIQSDIRDASLPTESFDVAVAAATLHHLRADEEWDAVFASVHRSLKPGGSFWIWDLLAHDPAPIHDLMWSRYGDYLSALKGPAYRDHVFSYVDAEDTPRSLVWQIGRLQAAGFVGVEVLHKNACFAAFGAIKPRASGSYPEL
jgi:tRNA (cmo5U34)-methyltransferase